MPELPEVETLKRELQKTVVGKTVKDLEVKLPKVLAVGPRTVSNIRKGGSEEIRFFRTSIIGQKILKVARRAKMLLLDFSGPYSILIHLKLTGQLIFEKTKAKSPFPQKHTHLILTFIDGSKLYYNDLRRFGYWRLVKDEELAKVKELQEYGPEPFSREFILNYLMEKAKRRPSLTVKQFLMDQSVVAGIGNIYSDEILYWAKIRPDRKLRSLSMKDFKGVYENIPKVLEKAISAQGSSVGDFLKLDGSQGKFGQSHMVYQRAGQKCRKCGSIIKSLKLGGRTSCFCPECQH